LTELLHDIDIEIAERNQLTLDDVRVVAEKRRRTSSPHTQGARLLAYVMEHPDCTSLDIVRDLNILNHTARVSELRRAGYDIVVTRDTRRSDVFHYRLVTKRETSAG
jgi:hypothetical protein